MERSGDGAFVLRDTRGLDGTRSETVLTPSQAAAALAPHPLNGSPETAWALDARVAVDLDGRSIPLATADPEMLLVFEWKAPEAG